MKKVLNNDAELIIKIFNCEKDGNWVDQTMGGAPGTNILHLKKSVKELSEEFGITVKKLREKIENTREKLFEARRKRIHPHKDDKILTDWNGLMISALSKASQVFNEKKYADAAEKAIAFIQSNLFPQEKKLLHRFREGEAGLPANIDDYAFLISGLLDLYETVFKVEYLKLAVQLQHVQIDHFLDSEHGGFFFTATDAEKLLVRQKEIYDGAIPSGNSVSLLNLLRIGKITGNPDFEEIANKLIKSFSIQISGSPTAFTQFLNSLDFAFGPSKEIVVVGKTNDLEVQKMLNLIREKYIPGKVILFKNSENPEIDEIAEFTQKQNMLGNRATVYVCENYSCKMPITSVKDLEELLK